MSDTAGLPDFLDPLLRQWFISRFGKAMPVQSASWEAVAGGRHLLLTAPTGSGKTLAAFLYGINQIVNGTWPADQTSILYISPLKALNSDIRANLQEPLQQLQELYTESKCRFPEISVALRSGDSSRREREDIFKKPPSIFITTPETLHLLLSQPRGIAILSSLRCVILDEIHSLAGNRRGTLLSASLERLVVLSGEFQRIGLSATVRPVDRIGAYLCGGRHTDTGWQERPWRHIDAGHNKKYDIQLVETGIPFGTHGDEFWRELSLRLVEIALTVRSLLIFVNSRKLAETISRFMNAGQEEPLAYAHHGSLSKTLRGSIEERMREGQLKAIVATNTLELGIDIGSIDLVAFVQPPFTIASFLQKLGRAGHQVGAVSRGVCLAVTDLDTIGFKAYIKAVQQQEIEEIRIPQAPLDVLSQLIISAVLTADLDTGDYFRLLGQSYSYRNLDIQHYDTLLRFLSGYFKGLPVKEVQKRIEFTPPLASAAPGTRPAFFASSGTIPDRGYFIMRTAEDRIVGELDEEFVWERKIGDSFVFANNKWKILNIDNNHVTVRPDSTSPNSTIFWKAEEYVSPVLPIRKTGEMLSSLIQEQLTSPSKAGSDALFANLLSRDLRFEPGYLYFEHTRSPEASGNFHYLFIHSFAGGAVNKALHLAIQGYLDRENIQAQVYSTNLLIALISCQPIHFSLIDMHEGFSSCLYHSLENSGFFGARFREIANRFLILPSPGFRKRFPLWLNRTRTKQFYKRVRKYRDNPVIAETWREILEDILDIDAAAALLDKIHTGELKEKQVHTASPSMLCDNMVFQMTNVLMYADDRMALEHRSSLSISSFLHYFGQTGSKESAKTNSRRGIAIDPELLKDFNLKLKSLTPEYCPDSPRALLAHIEERILVPEPEWQVLLELYQNNTQNQDLPDSICILDSDWARGITTCHGAAILAALAGSRPLLVRDLEGNDCQIASASAEAPEESAFLAYLLEYYGPMSVSELSGLFGFDPDWLRQWLGILAERQPESIIYGKIQVDVEEDQVLLMSNLERLLYWQRSRKDQPLIKSMSHQYILLKKAREMNVRQRLESMLEVKLPIEDWKEMILPLRFPQQDAQHLDRILGERSIIAIVDGRNMLFYDSSQKERISSGSADSTLLPAIGCCSIKELLGMTAKKPAELVRDLRQELLKGRISADSLEGLFRLHSLEAESKNDQRISYTQWLRDRMLPGNWFCIPQYAAIDPESIEGLEQEKDRVRQLLERWGIIYRELLTNLPRGYKISGISRALRLMELSGEIRSGYFVNGMESRQYSTPAFLAACQRSDQEPAKTLVVYSREPWFIVEDMRRNYPRMQFFVALSGPDSPLVYCPGKKSLDGFTTQQKQSLKELAATIPGGSLKIETVNQEPVTASAFLSDLLDCGAIRVRKGLRLDTWH